ncbi:MAG: septum formation inhibitor Maf [Armatimonadetes bacterium]|nr:septum formation inhibitor Maf [Armatimonadota bacterium]
MVILASASPRRHQLLKQVVEDFLIVPTDIDEDALTTDDPIQTAETLAFEKANAVPKTYENPVIIGCDTVVALDGRQYAKPRDRADAIRILQTLRGRTHQVITGVAVLAPHQSVVSHCVTHVSFNDVSDQEIENYVDTGEPMDKAGAYGAQGMGSFLVKSLDGPFDNVVGLPLDLTRELLNQVRA